jgi:hypothetical protein
MKRLVLLPIALCALVACKSNNKPNTEPAGDKPSMPVTGSSGDPAAKSGATPDNAPSAAGGDDTAGCATFATIATKCAGTGDAKELQTTCISTLEKNDAMTAPMRKMVTCATSNAECDGYNKCMMAP